MLTENFLNRKKLLESLSVKYSVRPTLAAIVDNHFKENPFISIESKRSLLEIVVSTWLDTVLYDMISIQPLFSPCGIIHYFSCGKMLDDPVATQTFAFKTKMPRMFLEHTSTNNLKDIHDVGLSLQQEIEKEVIDDLKK